MRLRVLTWNLLHGRAVPPAGHELFDEFCVALAGWEWDVALLQEVPPWWPAPLAEHLDAEQRSVLTSRNALLALRRVIAVRWPDLIKSNGGGANAILIRGDAVAEHRRRRLCLWPERRWVHAVRLSRSGLWVANLHAGGPMRDAVRATDSVTAWAGPEAPVVLGGDFNIRRLALDGFEHAAGSSVDHVFVRDLQPVAGEVLERGRLSDHAPVRAEVTIDSAPAP
jgi:endonuclease/exonuclease/phosphatase family metal-dependent hydrolase